MLRGKHAPMKEPVPWWLIFLLAFAALVAVCGLGMMYVSVQNGGHVPFGQ